MSGADGRARTGLLGRIIGVGGPAVQDAAGANRSRKWGKSAAGRVGGQLWFLFGVEAVEVALELVEAVHGGQILVAIAQMVLAELARGVAERFEQLGNSGILSLQAHRRGRHADLAQPGTEHALAGDERSPPSRATLLPR